MMELPLQWTILPESETAVLCMELLAPILPSGRILDNFHIALGGTGIV